MPVFWGLPSKHPSVSAPDDEVGELGGDDGGWVINLNLSNINDSLGDVILAAAGGDTHAAVSCCS